MVYICKYVFTQSINTSLNFETYKIDTHKNKDNGLITKRQQTFNELLIKNFQLKFTD